MRPSLLPNRAPGNNCRGTAIVEFALLLPIFLMLVFGIVELGRAIWYYDALSKATRNAARYLSTVTVDQFAAELADASMTESIVVAAASNARVPDFKSAYVTVSCTPTASCKAPSSGSDVIYVQVAVSYPLTLGAWLPAIEPLSVPGSVTLGAHTSMRYMR